MKNTLLNTALLLLVSLLAQGCQTLVEDPDRETTAKQEKTSPELPFEPTTKPTAELSNEILFHYLAGELSAQRKNLDQAFNNYLQAAMLAKDPKTAEKAARIALHQENTAGALRATNLWVEYDPNSIHARQLLAVLNHRSGNQEWYENVINQYL